MRVTPPSIGENVRLNPLKPAIQSLAYKSGFMNLRDAEPSLGSPTGFTITQNNSAYYFLVVGNDTSLLNSRKFTGFDNLVFVNKNLGYNTIYPTFNVDISGTFHALSAYIERLSADYIVPPSGSNTLLFDYNKIFFNTDVFFNNDAFVDSITARSLFVDFLSAKREITTTIYIIYQLTGAYVDQDVIIAGNLTATNVFGASSVRTTFLSAASAFVHSLSANFATITNTLSVGKNIFANKIYGKIDIDPFSQLYYNDQNQLSINTNQDYTFVVRPSDEYSTDNIRVPRTLDGDWWSDYGNVHEDEKIHKPFFKSLQPIFDYVYKNGIIGNKLKIYIDEDIIEGEDKVNYFTTDKSGTYAGCTVQGNLSAGFYSTEWIGSRFPQLTAAGVLGGDFIWGFDNNADMSGVFSYINVPPIQFKNVDIYGRYEIGSLTRTNGTKYYTLSGRRFNDAPRKISLRSYVCTEPRLPFGTFTPYVSTWTACRTKTSVQGRQVAFRPDTNVSLNNLCFEFHTNSNDSTGLVFYDGQIKASNLTVALLGNGVYTYGALNLNSTDTYFHLCGFHLADPTRFTPTTWNVLNFDGYNYETPNIYPGYGIAIIGNRSIATPTIINFGNDNEYTGILNVNNGAFFDKTDYDIARKVGRYTQLQSSVILDGRFNAYSYYQLGDNSRIQGSEILFITDGFSLSSRNIRSNNTAVNGLPATFNLQIYDNPSFKFNFKYINFKGTFSTLVVDYNGYTAWTFKPSDSLLTRFPNSYLNVFNGNINDPFYIFSPLQKSIDLSQSLLSIGYINRISPTVYNNENSMKYVGVDELLNYRDYYILQSPFNTATSYTLNYYTSSLR
jgi:hypothetical protein